MHRLSPAASHLVVEVEVHKPRNAFGKLSELSDGLHGGALAAVEHVDPDLLGKRRAVNQLAPHQTTFGLPESVHVVDHKRLNGAEGSTF